MSRSAPENLLISAVLPVYNEAHVLEELMLRVSSAIELCGARQEIVFVNDGSSDASPRILDGLAARHPQVRVVHLSRNFGHQAAVQAGLAQAVGDVVVLMDSDLQDSPEAISRLLSEWRAGYDVVYALRQERPEALWKRCLFAGFHRLLAAVSDTTIPVDAGNFSLIDGRVVREIVALGERDRYLPGLRSWVGFRQKGIEVRRQPRYDERPRVSLRGLWRLAKTAVFSFSSLPLAMFYVIGYSALMVFLTLGCYSLFCRLLTTSAVPGWTSNVLVASFFGAVNSLGISVLGEYVTRIYDQVRGRPLFVVDRVANPHGAGAAEASHALAIAAAAPCEAAAQSQSDEESLLCDAEKLLDLSRAARVVEPDAALTVERRGRNSPTRKTSAGRVPEVGKGGKKGAGRQAKQRRGH